MEHKIINTGDYLLIVDNSEIKEGDWCIDIYKLKNNHNPIFKWSDKFKVDAKKIKAHLPLNNSPILEGVDLLPKFSKEENVEKKSYDFIKDIEGNGAQRLAFIDGYLEAKEKYKYTEEDMVICWIAAYTDAISLGEENHKPLSFENFIQSLQQPKIPVGFKNSIEILNVLLNEKDISFPAKTTNSQGLTQWVGEYIY